MDEPAQTNNDSVDEQLLEVQLKLAQAQRQKLELEIKDLEKKRKWYDGVVRYIPLITAILSIAGFLWGVVLFLNQQERDRQTRQEDRISRDQLQYRNSYEQLLQFSTNPNLTVQSALFLRRDISDLIDALYPPNSSDQATKNKNTDEKARLKADIYNLITNECDFTQTRHVKLDIETLKDWSEYEKDLKVTDDAFMKKYIYAIRFLHVRDPKYIESVTYNPKLGYTEVSAPTEPLSNSFQSLVEGFRLHLQLLGKEDREKAIDAFISVTNNPTLAIDLFGQDSRNLK